MERPRYKKSLPPLDGRHLNIKSVSLAQITIKILLPMQLSMELRTRRVMASQSAKPNKLRQESPLKLFQITNLCPNYPNLKR